MAARRTIPLHEVQPAVPDADDVLQSRLDAARAELRVAEQHLAELRGKDVDAVANAILAEAIKGGSGISDTAAVVQKIAEAHRAAMDAQLGRVRQAEALVEQAKLDAQRPAVRALWDRLLAASAGIDEALRPLGDLAAEYNQVALELSMAVPEARGQLRASYRVRAAVPPALAKALGIAAPAPLAHQLRAKGIAGLHDLSADLFARWLNRQGMDDLPAEEEADSAAVAD